MTNCTNEYQSTTCHGRGECVPIANATTVNVSRCVCEDGFTGRSDWVNLEFYGGGCHIRETGVTIAYVTLLLCSIACVLNLFKFLKQQKKKKKRKKGKNNALIFVAWILCCSACTISLAVLKIASGQKYLLGNDFLPTVFYAWGRICFYVATVYIQRAFFQLALGNAMTKNKEVFVKAERIAWTKVVFDCISSIMPLVATFIDEGDTNLTIYKLNGLFGAISISGSVYAAIMARKSIKTAFQGGTSDKRLARVEAVLDESVKSAVIAAGINVPAFLLWGFVKSFYGYWTYLLPAQYSLIMVASIKLLKSLSGKSNKKNRRVTAADSGASSTSSESSEAESTKLSVPPNSVA